MDLEIGAAPLVADADRQLVVRRPPQERDLDAVVVPVGEFSTGALDEIRVRHVGSARRSPSPTSRVMVGVVDARTDDSFELEVDGRHALDAFNHPYAYAARVPAASCGRAPQERSPCSAGRQSR